MSYPQNRIFTPIRNQPLTGRNANIQPTMYKRKQIFEKVPVERSQTPFSGHSFTGSSISETNMLARSQVSDFSQDNVIRLIKQQMQKNGHNNTSQTSQQNLKNKNELNIIRVEVRSIKQSYHELNKLIKRKFDQQNQLISSLKKQIDGQAKSQNDKNQQIPLSVDKRIKQLQQDMLEKTRKVFNKTQQQLKQVTNYVNRQCVPRSFIDDVERQLSQLDNRIIHLQGQYESSNNKNIQNNQSIRFDKDSSVIIASGSQLKINKLERDFQNMRKIIDQKSQKIKQLDQLIQTSRLNQLKQVKQIKQLINQSNNQIKKQLKIVKQELSTKIQNQKKAYNDRIQTQIQSLTKKIDSQNLMRSMVVSNTSGNLKPVPRLQNTIFAQENIGNSLVINQGNRKVQNLSQSIVSKVQQSTVISQFDQQSSSKKNTRKITVTFGVSNDKIKNQVLATSNVEQINIDALLKQKQLSISNVTNSVNIINNNIPLSGSQITQNKVQKQIKKKVYKVDRNGYLMDNENKYLLNSLSSMIKISEQKLSAMQQTNLIKIQRWAQNTKQ